jgi:hypothetical protein
MAEAALALPITEDTGRFFSGSLTNFKDIQKDETNISQDVFFRFLPIDVPRPSGIVNEYISWSIANDEIKEMDPISSQGVINSELYTTEHFFEKKLNAFEREVVNQKTEAILKLAAEDSDWTRDGILPPNDFVVSSTIAIVENLAFKGIFDFKISPSIEEGIVLTFKERTKKLYFELYNDEQFGYIIEDLKNNQVLENRNVDSIDHITEVISEFVHCDNGFSL